MTTEIRVPALGESVSEANVSKWYKQQGDAVAAGEDLLELETDKVTIDVPSPVAGIVAEILIKEGETVEMGALLGSVTEGAAAVVSPPSAASEQNTADIAASPLRPAAVPAAESSVAPAVIGRSEKAEKILQGGVSESLAVVAAAVPAAAAALQAVGITGTNGGEERVRMTKLRQTIAGRLKDAQNTAAMLTTFNEVDMSAVMALRKNYRDLFEKKHNVKLGFMGFFTKAVCHALSELPAVNAEIDGTDIVYKNFAHIGVAVGTDKGLVVPVIRHAEQRSIAGIEQEISRLGKAAREGTLSVADMQGGTFTITNGGIYGSLMSTPILNAPQSAILGMHSIKERPIAENGQVVIRPMMYLALSYDHRLVDGREAVTFLVRVKESLENPERLVLDL